MAENNSYSNINSNLNSPERENSKKISSNNNERNKKSGNINTNTTHHLMSTNPNNNNNISKEEEKVNPNYYYNPIPETLYRTIIERFKVFTIIDEEDIDQLKLAFPNKIKISKILSQRLNFNTYNSRQATKLEIFVLLTIFCFESKLDKNEICALFSIIWDIMALNFHRINKKLVFENFKKSIVILSIDRPPFEVSIFKKKSLELISSFFVDNIYSKFELLKYLTTDRKLIEIKNSEIFHNTFPHSLDLEFGEEILPRQVKFLKEYYEEKKPKSELELKIEKVMEYQRERL